MTDTISADATRLNDILDRETIRETLYNIASGVDRFDPKILAAAIWDDAILDMGGGKTITGSDFINALKPPVTPPKGRMHIVTNVRIRINRITAVTESLILSCQQIVAPDGERTRLRAGRYLDRFEKRGAEWKLSARTLVDEWAREDTVDQAPLTGEHRGTPAPHDLVQKLFYNEGR
ncbi:MAG: nuclear transport factor 2 family protein [Parvularculaceae bacterium]|nr:nuclear transport factor 2 family protein [Parvularculaceae bacterium]